MAAPCFRVFYTYFFLKEEMKYGWFFWGSVPQKLQI